jgi:hypothetical protein
VEKKVNTAKSEKKPVNPSRSNLVTKYLENVHFENFAYEYVYKSCKATSKRRSGKRGENIAKGDKPGYLAVDEETEDEEEDPFSEEATGHYLYAQLGKRREAGRSKLGKFKESELF